MAGRPGKVRIERRDSGGRAERLPEFAAELIRLNVDVILAVGRPDVEAVLRATPTLPVVTVYLEDPRNVSRCRRMTV